MKVYTRSGSIYNVEGDVVTLENDGTYGGSSFYHNVTDIYGVNPTGNAVLVSDLLNVPEEDRLPIEPGNRVVILMDSSPYWRISSIIERVEE